MSTPIEVVRAHIDALTGNRSHGFARVTAALASVLADAERYAALELFMQASHDEWPCIEKGVQYSKVFYGAHHSSRKYVTADTLSELADRLREGAT